MAGPLTFDDIETPKSSGPLTFDDVADPYAEAANKRVSDMRAHGIDPSGGILRRYTKGAGLGWADDIAAYGGAAVDTLNPLNMGNPKNTFANNLKYRKAFEKALDKDAADRTGALGTAAEIAGSFTPGEAIAGLVNRGIRSVPAVANTLPAIAGPGAGALPAVVSRGLPAVAGSVAPAASVAPAVANTLGKSILTGGITGGVEAAGNDQSIAEGVGLGGLGGAGGHAVGKTLETLARIGKISPSLQDATSAAGLKAKAQEAYDRFTNSGGRYTPAFLQDMKSSLGEILMDNSWSKKVAPKVGAVIDEIDKIGMTRQMGLGDPTPKMIQNIRGLIGSVRKSTDPEERRFGHLMMTKFDDLVSNAQPHHFNGPEDIGQHLAEGNRLWTQFSKADALENAFGKAERRAASTYSGGNLENAQRQEVRKLYENRSQGWTPDELAQINRVIYGDRVQNTARAVGKALDPTGIKGILHLGAAGATHGMSIPVGMVGMASKYAAEKMSSNAIEELSRIIRAGGKRRNRIVPESVAERATRRLTPRLAGPAGYGMAGLLSDDQ